MSSTEKKNQKRYSQEELKEFELLIKEKLAATMVDLDKIKESLSRANDNGTDNTSSIIRGLEDGSASAEKESLSQQGARLQKYKTNLENALVRIKNGTYGVCSTTGELISKERLRVVPHTTQSISAKNKQR